MVIYMVGEAIYQGDPLAAAPTSFPEYLYPALGATAFGAPFSFPVALTVRLDNTWRAVPFIAVVAAFGIELQIRLGRIYEESYVSLALMLVWIIPAIFGTVAALLLKWRERTTSFSITAVATATLIVFVIEGAARARELAPAYLAAETWSRLHVGMNVFTGDEGNASGQTVCPTLAASLDEQNIGLCRHVAPATAAVVDAIIPCKKTDPDWGYESPRVRIHAADGSWAGFTDAGMLQPKIPVGTLIEMARDWDSPVVMNDDRGRQTIIGDEAMVKVLRYDPKRNVSLYVSILDGAHRGETGWMYIQGVDTGGVALGEYSLEYQDCGY